MRSPAARRTLARSYEDDGIELDNADRAKLEMLDSYMSSAAGDADDAEPDAALAMPTRPEDVDKFMEDLAAAAAGLGKPPREDEPDEEDLGQRI